MSPILVLDSSVIVKWLNSVDEENIDKTDKILADTLKGKLELIAPELAKYEIGNVLLLKKKLSKEEAEFSFQALYTYPIQFIAESEDLAKETYRLASTLGITYYDAAFLSLAKQYDALLVTENVKHQGKSKAVKVISLQDY